ncbi:hypothetical protein [Verminephrobacter aporrectodeae]|uniref:Plasmid stabilization protein n=1 Tax=Verminephrobacter aporrectodeae subsp. tuberculatae TaxID=1110392 RepID=A0ABT3KRH0_9BURK|nr:hypothetical protein [Verminephrobacter aporrectodeae]MCW5220129.1 plasmid stabilization protein [Verminephrobacter aporrectodeae subsp. tuberculatae]MCW5255908.1 plasmid stabilization protein [Verminephrobacter aporrectodeae subsp. tuberculatae]MCW5289417.1 plasmid stabilization protein [Verminephrobacter aporrectodeae subsp. tuberculatae]MCW5320922.1 plasmid stabilization protein [Verminephrobacter aporrectodeae subsp. tuberculatae]MCW8165608.1 plasmid stabilization protein [Verminephroba
MTTTATHYENANFLRELAEALPRILPSSNQAKAELLQRFANEELAQAEYDDWVRARVAASRADKQPGMSTEQLRQILQARYQELRDAP